MTAKDNANPIIHTLTSHSIRATDTASGFGDDDEWWAEPSAGNEKLVLGDWDGFSTVSDAWSRANRVEASDNASESSLKSSSPPGLTPSLDTPSNTPPLDEIDQQEVFGECGCRFAFFFSITSEIPELKCMSTDH